jgi:hypothetical protein
MPDEKNMGHDLNVKDEQGTTPGMTGKNPEHAPRPGMKMPQKDEIDEDAIDESGNLIYDDGKDENDAK